jgi:isoleucyl-tRNA synthetase
MAKFHLPSLEEAQLKLWEDKRVFRQVMDKKPTRGNFVFFEGPPTANGKPGIHHILARSFKDVVLRYRTMRGYHIDRKAGWDTHGLPVELEVEKQLGFTKKQDIEDFGIAEFNAKCKESVWTYLDQWQSLTKRTAFWVDLDDPYITYKNDYVESLWWILKQVWDKGLLNKGYRTAPHCPRCVTSLSSHELAQGYKDVDDESVFVKFPIDEAAKRYFLVWTTTPWTLPGNVALAVGSKVDYVEVKLKETGEQLILAKSRLAVIDGEYDTVAELTAEALTGIPYQALYNTMDESDHHRVSRAYKPYLADFVSTEDGTGIVHIAPAFGEDDSRLGEKEELPTLFTVNDTGEMVAAVPGQGKFVKDADADIKADLSGRGLLYKAETYTHSYPFCWRCSTPLIYLAKSSWYIRMSQLREELQARNAEINWVPGHIKDGRFGEWLREVKDWALSRERYWGTPLPVWQCPNGHMSAIGSLAELEERQLEPNQFTLVRHGEAESNQQKLLSSWPEPAEHLLTAAGRETVTATAAELKKQGVDVIYASDLLRTKQTAELISEATGVPVVYDERLRELDLGDFNGKHHEEYFTWRDAQADPYATPIPGGESWQQCRMRMVDFIKDINRQHRGKKIVVVSHGDPLWQLESALAGLSLEEARAAEYPQKGVARPLAFRNLPYDREGNVDVHRPFIDEVPIKCDKCDEPMTRATDVLDCWFDSGAMPFAQYHYPFKNADRIDSGQNFPADYISEAIDQTRGWFYTLLAVATALGKETPPYKNVICLGHILDGKGQKMSKSKGNVVNPWEMIDQYGADSIRWLFFTVNQPGEAKRFDEKSLEEITKKVFLILWNVLSFWQMYAGEEKAPAVLGKPSADPMDRWILAEIARLNKDNTDRLDSYDVVGACRDIGSFVTDLSTWYLRRSRDRFKSADAAEKQAAVATLGYVLRELAKLMAPFTPFLADALYKEVGGGLDSVHLESWPELPYDEQEQGSTLRKMQAVRQAASVGLEQRASAGLPVRQVLASAKVTDTAELEDWAKAILAAELNVEAVESVVDKSGTLAVELDTELTPELKRKGAVREVTRNVNALRKEAGLTFHDQAELTWQSDSEFWQQVVAEYGEEIASNTRSSKLVADGEPTDGTKEVTVDGQTATFGLRKL